ncbi:MAG: C40 family peptidase [Aestuariivirga sp.]
MTELDRRLHAYRSDLADARLLGRIVAERFVEGRLMQMADPLIAIHKAPRFDAMQISQALMGETVRVFEVQEGWAFAQLERDGYVGYVSADALSLNVVTPTHRLAVPLSFLYTAPDIKAQPAVAITMNAALTITGGDEKFAQTSDGRFVYRRHLKPVGEPESDFVAVAEMFRNAPYYWGGKSVHGFDCSGLVQLALEACGMECPRDTDMQERQLGSRLALNDLDNLKRGDLVFWTGHTGVMLDTRNLLHANGYHMMTVVEPLAEAVARIGATGNPVTSVRRL